MTNDSLHKQSDFQFQWLEPIQTPLVNKFYREYGFNGKAKRSDRIAICKQGSNIVAAALLRPFADDALLTGVAVQPQLQGNKLASRILAFINHDYQQRLFCFALAHLESWYQKYDFQRFNESQLPTPLANKWQAYLNQGRRMVCMCRDIK